MFRGRFAEFVDINLSMARALGFFIVEAKPYMNATVAKRGMWWFIR
jgi:hypothetical protein